MSGKPSVSFLARARRKLVISSRRDEWCAYLTPSEFLALAEDGLRACSHEHKLVRAKEKQAAGESDSDWYYFSRSHNRRLPIFQNNHDKTKNGNN